MKNTEPFVLIIGQYHQILERYARRYMVNKHMACSVVKEVFESMYAQGALTPSPQLRQLLKDNARRIWQEIDLGLERAEKALANHLLNKNNF